MQPNQSPAQVPNVVQPGSSPNDTPPPSTASEPTWQYNAENNDQSPQVQNETPLEDSISWTASEFIAHSKASGWYLIFTTIIVATGAIIYLFTKDIFTLAILGIMAILFGYTASRKPRELPYLLDENGLTIDKKLYPYATFKSFSVVQESGVEAIWLLPLQRFAPGLSIYFEPTERDKIIDYLSEFLPIEERKLDLVDTLMHKIRF